jgi:hypothetical protein
MSTGSGSCSTLKRKRTKKEISEQARRDAENLPSVRLLREMFQRGMAEIEERRKLDPNYR